MLIASLALVIAGMAIYRIGVRGENGDLPRQRTMGLRTKATLSSDEAWHAAQQAGADLVKAAGAISFIGGLVSVPLYNREAVAAAVVLGTAVLMLIVTIKAGMRGQAAARAVVDASQEHQV